MKQLLQQLLGWAVSTLCDVTASRAGICVYALALPEQP
jgi:hypothetical protein